MESFSAAQIGPYRALGIFPYEMTDADAVEWFFDRLGIKPPVEEDEDETADQAPVGSKS